MAKTNVVTRIVTRRKNRGEIIRTEDRYGNTLYVLLDNDGNFVRSSFSYNNLHGILFNM